MFYSICDWMRFPIFSFYCFFLCSFFQSRYFFVRWLCVCYNSNAILERERKKQKEKIFQIKNKRAQKQRGRMLNWVESCQFPLNSSNRNKSHVDLIHLLSHRYFQLFSMINKFLFCLEWLWIVDSLILLGAYVSIVFKL